MRGKARGLIRGGFLFALVIAGCTGRPPGAEFVRRTEWIGKGTWLEADLHMHSRFSDGRHEPALLVQKAREHGCGAIAITDHSDRDLEGASDGYFAATAAARRENPDLVILDGLEWNAPPGAGDDHVNVLVPPGPDGVRVLKEIKARFDDLGRDSHDEKLAHEALQWLDDQSAAWAVPPAVIFNHPSRKVARSLDQLDKLRRFREVTPHLIGIEGAPGHQGATPLGSYPGPEAVVDRWDPAAARVGDVWDRLLASGEDWWGALAFSDFHEERADGLSDHWPGQFAETWLYVPERTAEGVLRALRAGSFFAGHGAIVREVAFEVEAAGLPRPAWAGEAIRVPASAEITVRVAMSVPERDWSGAPNRIDRIELIAVDAAGARVIAARAPDVAGSARTAGEAGAAGSAKVAGSAGTMAAGATAVLEESLRVPPGGVVLRARGRRQVAGGPALCFYTNAIRVIARGG